MHHRFHSQVLQLDIQGTPQAWIPLEHAAIHLATSAVAWVDGTGPLATLRGGFNVARGRQSLPLAFGRICRSAARYCRCLDA